MKDGTAREIVWLHVYSVALGVLILVAAYYAGGAA